MPRELSHKMTLVAALNMLLLAAAGALAIFSLLHTHDALLHLTEHTLQQAHISGDFHSALSSALADAQDFAITGDPAERVEIDGWFQKTQTHLTALEQLDSSSQQDDAFDREYRQIQARRRALFAQTAQQIGTLIQATETYDRPRIAAALIDVERLQQEAQRIRDDAERLLERDVLGASSTAQRLLQRALWIVGLTLAVFGLPIAFGRLVVQRRIVQPINALAVAADAVARGDLGHAVQVTSDDEIGDVQRAFNQMIGSLRDQSATLMQQAFYDPLTHLPNRRLFMNRLDHALSRAARSNSPVGLLFLDLDNFKVINDSLGHAVGDRLLTVFAATVQQCVRPGDTVARLGGDEFTILLEDISDLHDAAAVALRIHERLQQPLLLDDHEIFTMTSIGITVSLPGESTPDELFREADMAMYRAKLDGKGRYTVFDARMSGQARDRLELEQDLRRAIERNELELYYQPIVSLADDRIVAMEALVRWQHPQRGFVPPTLFIALAEETGLIVPLGQRVLASACGQMAAWHQRYPHERPVRVCVNLSPRQCHAPTLLADIQRTVQETGLDAASLELEITESVLMEPGPRTSEMLQALKQLGIRLSIDDFGTGYSSLAYLQRFPSDTLKIDRSFVQGIARDSKGAALVRAVIMVAQALELEVIAEGIETPEQLAVLQELKCDLGQGFYIGEPLPASAADAFLSSAARSPGVVNARRAVDHALHV